MELKIQVINYLDHILFLINKEEYEYNNLSREYVQVDEEGNHECMYSDERYSFLEKLRALKSEILPLKEKALFFPKETFLELRLLSFNLVEDPIDLVKKEEHLEIINKIINILKKDNVSLEEGRGYLTYLLGIIKNEREKAKELIEVRHSLTEIETLYKEMKKENDNFQISGAAKDFKKQSSKLYKRSLKWIYTLFSITSIWIILIISLYIFSNEFKVKEVKDLIIFIPLTTPFIFIVGYCLNQYTKERNLEEAYSFKTNQLMALEKHLSYFDLKKSSYAQTDEILKYKNNFLLETLHKIHTSPLEDSNKGQIKAKNTLKTVEQALKVLNNSGIKLSVDTPKQKKNEE